MTVLGLILAVGCLMALYQVAPPAAPAAPAPTDTSISASNATPSTPALTSPAPSPGAAPPTAAPQHQPAAPSGDVVTDLSQRVSFIDPATGQRMTTTLGELHNAQRQLSQIDRDGYDLYARAIKGDTQAAHQFLDRFGGAVSRPNGATPPAGGAPQQTQAGPQDLQAQLQSALEQIEAMKPVVNHVQTERVHAGVKQLLAKPEFAALAKRPDAVTYLLRQIDFVTQGGRQPIDTNGVLNLAGQLNQTEQEYQNTLLQGRAEAGELAIENPFRGLSPEQVAAQEPDPKKDWNAYAKWAGNKLRAAIYQDTVAAGR